MANARHLAKALAQDVKELDTLLADAHRAAQRIGEENLAWQRKELVDLLAEATSQLYIVKTSMLAYAKVVEARTELSERIIL